MAITKWLGSITALIVLVSLMGCSSMKIDDYKMSTPKLDLFNYFEGKTKAYGQFTDRSGKVLRRFDVDIVGTLDAAKKTLVLEEDFVYNDGEKQRRVWTIKKIADNEFIGSADDVVGEAQGQSAGNALNWHYTLDLPYKDGSIHVKFDDWMYLHNQDVMFNQAKVSKWGFKVGEVTLFFSKRLAD
jgi:hypothetical protein